MKDNNLLFLNGNEVLSLLQGREKEIMEVVRRAYQIHEQGDTTLPHSSFLQFPKQDRERIIALPAYLGGEFNIAGIKWIASFPNNIGLGLERASATLLLNSTKTGHLQAILESSIISAKRTAASATLAAHYLSGGDPILTVGAIGCGLINFETIQFLVASHPEIETIFITDLDEERTKQFKNACIDKFTNITIIIANTLIDILTNAQVISLATTALKPHVSDISACNPQSIILHTSLRDLSAEIILSADNIVDDIDHVCRAQTSVHLASQQAGNRHFIRCTLGEIINGTTESRPKKNKVSIFSPFGLGVLDLAVGALVSQLALAQQQGTMLGEFLPTPWTQRSVRI